MRTARKKLIVGLFAVALSGAAAFAAAPTPARAQALVPLQGNQSGDTTGSLNPGLNPVNSSGSFNPNGATTVTPTSPGGNAAADQNKAGGGLQQPVINKSAFPGCGINLECWVAQLAYIPMSIAAFFLYLAGWFLDLCLLFTLNISSLIARVPVVDIGWKIFRDLANIFFIFILLWIAISTILGLSSGKTKEMLAHLIIVALLMNFSLFITKAVIDASDIVALHFYNLAVPADSSYAGQMMRSLKIQTLYDGSAVGEAAVGEKASSLWTRIKNAAVDGAIGTAIAPGVGTLAGIVSGLSNSTAIDWSKIILVAVFGSALMLVAAYTFIVGGILMLIRAIVLMFVMLLSPLAFLAYTLPSAEKYAEPWKEALIKQSIFAPAFMILSFVVIKTMQDPRFLGVLNVQGDASFAKAFTQGSLGSIGLIVNFFLVIGLMLGCILIAKKLEVHGLELAKEGGAFFMRQVARGTYVSAGGAALGYGAQGVGAVMKRVPGMEQMGDKVSGLGKRLHEGSEELQKKMDINDLDKKFRDSKFGATSLGAFIREKTTGGKWFGTQAKFGGEKSVHEAYEEDEALRSRREALQKVEDAKQAMARLKIADAARLPSEAPDWKNAKYKDASGNFNQAAFDRDFQKFTEVFRPALMAMPKREDFAEGMRGQKEFDTAMARYTHEQSAAGQTEMAELAALFEYRLDRKPKRGDFSGPDADKNFEAAQKKFVEFLTKAPDPSDKTYGTATGKVLYSQLKKIHDDGQDRLAQSNKEFEKAQSALGFSLNQVTPEDFARLHEEEIETLAPYANLRQLHAVRDSKESTMPDKRKMLGTRWAKEIADFQKFSAEIIQPYKEAWDKLDEAIKAKKIDLDESGNIDEQSTEIDPATGKKYVLFNDGSGEKLEIPVEPKLPSHLKAWARNKMTKEEYELASFISPQLFDNEDLVHVIRWGLTNKEFRTDENMPFDLRDRLTYMKDSTLDKVVEGSKSPNFIAEDTSDTRAAAIEAARDAAAAATDAARRKDKKTGAFIEDLVKAKERIFRSTYAKLTANDTIRARIATDWASGRAANEIAGARGRNRNSKAVHRLVGKGIAQYYREKDTEDISALLKNTLSDYRDEQNGRGIVSKENRELIQYLFTDPRCNIETSTAASALPAELQKLYRELKEQGTRGGLNSITFKSDDWKQGRP